METEFFMRPDLFWFLLGLAFFLLELIIPGFVVFFFGIGAWIAALACLVANPSLDLQIIIFSISSILTLILLRRMLTRRFFKEEAGSPPTLEDEFIGREAVSIENILKGGKGKVEFKGTPWSARAEDNVKNGQTVIITGKDSISLIVKPKNL
jgi:membrane protein implicated in regulation of membrane protease activity